MKRLYLLIAILLFSFHSYAMTRGIYLTQETAQDKLKMDYLIGSAKKYGIDTFVVDINVPAKGYAASIANILAHGIHYVARVVMFPGGATSSQIHDHHIWEKRLNLAKYAIKLGASAIQLDYIRYRAENPPRPERAKQVAQVVEYFKNQLRPYGVALQMDIFGIASIRPAHTIGQDPKLLANYVNAFCPMVYPSHFEPFRVHATRPYQTIFESVMGLRKQISANPNVGIYAYIELFNYRYPLSREAKMRYIKDEIRAAKDAGANGWYVWSASNHYPPLFRVLSQM